jgi:hypothetical protein
MDRNYLDNRVLYMRKFLNLRNLLMFGGIGLFIALLLFLFLEAFYSSNFRTTQDPLASASSVNLKGLRELKASGGTSVLFPDLKRRLSHIKEKKIIVDGISEFHGYIKGIPTTFFAYRHLHPKWKYYIRRFIFTGTTARHPEWVVSEAEEAKKNGFSHINVKVGSKFISSPEAIDELIRLFDTLPENVWIHFHCHYGKGRTSMMLVMYDIMKNAPDVSLYDITHRQHLLGSENLLNTTVKKEGSYTQKQLDERKDFITRFYAFICQRKAGGIQIWSEWLQTQPKKCNDSPLVCHPEEP